jgi:hypothetical protein
MPLILMRTDSICLMASGPVVPFLAKSVSEV